MSKVIFDGIKHFKLLAEYHRKKAEQAEREVARLESLAQQHAAQQSVHRTSESESQIDEDWSNDNDRIGEGVASFTRG